MQRFETEDRDEGRAMPFTIELSDSDWRALEFVKGRYESADILFDATEPDENREEIFHIAEHQMWAYRDALAGDWGYEPDDFPGYGYPPCIGGELADKLQALYDAIV